MMLSQFHYGMIQIKTMTKIEDLKKQIFVLTEKIKDKQDEIDNFEKELDEETYNDLLDSCYEEIDICGLKYFPSFAFYRVDPIAYRCGMNDFADSMELNEFPAYNDLVEELETLQSDLEDLENELNDLEEEEEEGEEEDE